MASENKLDKLHCNFCSLLILLLTIIVFHPGPY